MSRSKVLHRIRPSIAAFWSDESGVILPYVTMLLVVIVGVSLLALDGGRLRSLQSQAQNAADALALAGAAELNRSPGARTNATNAINNLVSNGLSGMGQTAVSVQSIVFYQSIPAESQSFTSGTVSPDDGHARFVAVTLNPITLQTIFPVSFISAGAANSITAGASAVAGFDEIACKYTPVFICNPYEGNLPYDAATAALINAPTGQMVTLQGAGNAQYAPGNFGWVSSSVAGTAPNCGSGNALSESLAQSEPPTCFNSTTINTQPGNIANADQAINIRFDLYSTSFKKGHSLSNCLPASNVRKGYSSGCNGSPQSPYPAGNLQAMGFPLDSNMLDSNGNPLASPPTLGNAKWPCADITGVLTTVATSNSNNLPIANATTSGIYAGMGIIDSAKAVPSGTTVSSITSSTAVFMSKVASVPTNDIITFVGYWNTAHPAVAGNTGNGKAPAGCGPTGGISRYQVYLAEIAGAYVNDKSAGGETGAPACYSGAAAPDPNRRVLNVAVLNCNNLIADGYKLQGAATNLPVAAFTQFFLTTPLQNSSGPIQAEYTGIATPGNTNSGLHYQVQLYR